MAELKAMTVTAKRCAIVLAIATGLATWIGWRHDLGAQEAQPAAAEVATPAAGTTSNTATIEFTTSPASNATVTWGNTRLGTIAPGEPLVIVRPRDSGSLDVVVRANGYLPVHTRAHTFSDSKMLVKLTSPQQQHTLLGYRAPIDAGTAPVTSDAGVPSSLFYAPPGAPAPAAGAAGGGAQP